MTDVNIGQYAIPIIMTVLLGLVYGTFDIENRLKPWIAVVLGVVLGMVAMLYRELPWTPVNVIDHVFYGIMTGASAVGLHEVKKATLPGK